MKQSVLFFFAWFLVFYPWRDKHLGKECYGPYQTHDACITIFAKDKITQWRTICEQISETDVKKCKK